VWLVNTGWIGGAFGVGKRIDIPYTRAMISAALNNKINVAKMRKDPIFGLRIPYKIDGVPAEILNPSLLWKDEKLYTETAEQLLNQFEVNLKIFNL
jgi:phosphoenolpyruvate carboxykinase (ATP)